MNINFDINQTQRETEKKQANASWVAFYTAERLEILVIRFLQNRGATTSKGVTQRGLKPESLVLQNINIDFECICCKTNPAVKHSVYCCNTQFSNLQKKMNLPF